MTNWLKVPNTAPEGMIPQSVKLSFYIGGLAFFGAVLWTVYRTREYPPEQMEAFKSSETEDGKVPSREQEDSQVLPAGRFYRQSAWWVLGGLLVSALIFWLEWEPELYVLSMGSAAFGLVLLLVGLMTGAGRRDSGLVVVINDLLRMPRTMAQLAVVQFFSWFALFSMWIYTTSAVTSHVFGTNDTTSVLYNEGADWVGVMFAVYNGFAAVVAFLLPVIARRTNRRVTHMISLIAGGLGLISIFFIHDKYLLILSMLGVGLAWASILSMPYAILTGSLPANKMGTYMGIFNFFIVIPQILAASLLGFFAKNLFAGQAVYTIMLGGGSMILASVLVLFVNDVDENNGKPSKQ
jgi:maltose/moltooligosaccharide transporter